jgi:hypothetical protein
VLFDEVIDICTGAGVVVPLDGPMMANSHVAEGFA